MSLRGSLRAAFLIASGGMNEGVPTMPLAPVWCICSRLAPRYSRDPCQRSRRRGRVLDSDLLRQILAGVAEAEIESGTRVGTIFDQAEFPELLVKSAPGNHQAVLVECVGFARPAGSRHGEDTRELSVRVDDQRQRAAHDAVVIADWS